MKRMKRLTFIAFVLAFLLQARAASAGLIIFSQATHLGGNSWQYDYTLSYDSSPPLGANQAIAVYFELGQYQNLEDQTPPLTEWITWVFDPDANLSADGEFDALAFSDNPAIPPAFTVKFTWLGGPGTAPGAQPFDILEFDADGNYWRTLGSGDTTMVPEPGTLALLGIGLAGLTGLARSRSKR